MSSDFTTNIVVRTETITYKSTGITYHQYYADLTKKRSSDVTTFNTPFDFKSVMMYGSNTVGRRTIVRKDNKGLIKGDSEMSATDWLRLKKLYNCK
ncbi:Uncharacterised protein r2_g2319 [Pycnogonum litorale]